MAVGVNEKAIDDLNFEKIKMDIRPVLCQESLRFLAVSDLCTYIFNNSVKVFERLSDLIYFMGIRCHILSQKSPGYCYLPGVMKYISKKTMCPIQRLKEIHMSCCVESNILLRLFTTIMNTNEKTTIIMCWKLSITIL